MSQDEQNESLRKMKERIPSPPTKLAPCDHDECGIVECKYMTTTGKADKAREIVARWRLQIDNLGYIGMLEGAVGEALKFLDKTKESEIYWNNEHSKETERADTLQEALAHREQAVADWKELGERHYKEAFRLSRERDEALDSASDLRIINKNLEDSLIAANLDRVEKINELQQARETIAFQEECLKSKDEAGLKLGFEVVALNERIAELVEALQDAVDNCIWKADNKDFPVTKEEVLRLYIKCTDLLAKHGKQL